MPRASEFLTGYRKIIKIHENLLKEQICSRYQLTLMEAVIISFLTNNPEKDTAADISDVRMLSKGNVSQGVDSLIRKSLLERRRDDSDRRRIHLSLTEKAAPIAESMAEIHQQFQNEIFMGLSQEELLIFEKVNQKITENMGKYINRSPR